MKHYRRVTYEDRCQIIGLLHSEQTIPEIAKRLGFDKTTIYRELSRNSVEQHYSSKVATLLASQRFERCRRKFLVTAKVEKTIESFLIEGWSPEHISGRLKVEKNVSVSYLTIYRFINRARKDLKKYLRQYGKRGAGRYLQRKYRDANRRLITERPKIVSSRSRIGDWERDGMYVGHKQQLLVLTERKSRFTKIARMESISPKEVTKLTQKILTTAKVFTMTNDNGPEFRDSKSLPYPTYHCIPGKPQQRGTVENTIGLLRQYLPRKTNLDQITESELQRIEDRINIRPRKVLNYRTPFEVLFKLKVALVT